MSAVADVLADHVSVAEAARRLGRSLRWTWMAIEDGRLAVVRPGLRCTLVSIAAIERLIANRQTGAED